MVSPENGWIKCDSDAAWSRGNNTAGLGVIRRDFGGSVSFSRDQYLQGVCSVIEDEARDVLLALYNIKNDIEVDSLILFRALVGNSPVQRIGNPTAVILNIAKVLRLVLGPLLNEIEIRFPVS